MNRIVTPTTESELASYYHFRWKMLRAPLQLQAGSEKDEFDMVAEHRMIVNKDGEVIAIGRMHLSTADEVQIRHMAVREGCRDRGLGSLIISTLEEVARKLGVKRVILFARKESVGFYEKCGYDISGEAPAEVGNINRKQMMKRLEGEPVFLRHPEWCQTLQQTWDKEIPIANLMGIKVHQYTGRHIEVRAALNANINLHGTMFAGSIYSHATLTGWGLIFLQLKEKGLTGDIVLADANIHYHKPVTQLPRATASVYQMQGNFDALKQGKKNKLAVTVNIMDENRMVAEFEGKYVILPKVATISE